MKYDIVVAGELLVDFITKDYVESLEAANVFERFKGGSGANLSCNMALLGGKAALVSTVGNDDMGLYLKKIVDKLPVATQYVETSDLPTTLILVTRTKDSSDFQPYRGADADMSLEQIQKALAGGCKIFHTTCFALSLEPARTSIVAAAAFATDNGATLSIDVNYRQKIWKNREQAKQVIENFIRQGALVKCSEEDWESLYESPFESPQAAAQYFIGLGATAVSITLGTAGCFSMDNAGDSGFIPARKVEVVDTTGAGDAFWSGFLTAWLDKQPIVTCAKAGRKMAETKIQVAGQLTEEMDKALLYQE
jgi:sugar/nucleoside kinase (ribokinase family)